MRHHVAAMLCAAVGCTSSSPTADPRAARPRAAVLEHRVPADARVAANAACAGCHPREAESWGASLHRRSFIDASFQRAFHRAPSAFCQGCHAPEAVATAPPSDAEADIGIGCVTCHAPVDGSDDAIVDVAAASLSADDDACGRCHEFAFPPSTRRPRGALMQSTLREHLASDYAELTCADCHMPRDAEGRVDHGFAITRRPDRLRAALVTLATRPSATTVELRLTPVDVGHAFPTGDLYRRLVLTCEAIAADGSVRARAQRELARHFPPPRPSTSHFVARDPPEHDDRLVATTSIVLHLPQARSEDRVRWRVVYERVDQRDPLDPAASSVFDQAMLATGELAAL